MMKRQKLFEKNKVKLLAEEKHLEAMLSRVAKPSEGTGNFQAQYEDLGNKEDDNALEVAQYAENLAEEHDLAKKLERVRSALERIKAGTYGICQKGGEEISDERLEAIPEAENCISHEK